MGVDDAERGRLLAQVMQDTAQHRVLEDIGEAAGMEGVAVIHVNLSIASGQGDTDAFLA